MRNKRNKNRKISADSSLRTRFLVLILIFLLLTGAIITRLFDLQIMKGESYENDFTLSIEKKRVLKSTRGEIFDCNGNTLAYNELTYDVTFEDKGSYESNRQRNLALNSILYTAIKIIESHGDTTFDNFRIDLDKDGNYVYNVKGFNLSRFKADFFGYPTIDELQPNEADISAPDLIDLMCSDRYYGLISERNTKEDLEEWNLPESFTPEEILQLCQFRSTLQANAYQRYNSIILAKDVKEETVSQLLENTGTLQGIDVTEDYKRIYNDALYFAPIIGYTGQVSAEELKELREIDSSYDSTDIVGKVGLEKVMETDLQGRKGSETIYVDNLGRTISTSAATQPEAGNSLYLTLDSDLQKACYKILEEYIAGILWANIVDTESIDESWIATADDVRIPVYDVYYSLFENNVLSVEHLSAPNASTNEQNVYHAFQEKASSIFSEIKNQLTIDDPTPYSELSDEMKVYQSYIVDTMLPQTGILNEEAIDKSDLTYKAWAEDESISLQELLTYALSKNWIDVNGITENISYMDSTEVYSALADYIAEYLGSDSDFCKRVFRYMLMEGSLSGAQVCLLLFDQGVLDMNTSDYDLLSNGSLGGYDFIRDKIYNLQITPDQLALNPCSGAIVVTDPDNGSVKACVTYPSYDSNRLVNEMDSAYYYKLVTDLSSPFYSRATQELLAPGSTFKPVAAAAGVSEGILATTEGLYCTGEFDGVDPTIKCWIYPGAHGTETLADGIKNSCNFFFNTIGWRLASVNGSYDDDTGVKRLQKYASMFGLDSASGIEVPESSPHMLTYDAVRGAMGQADNAYTVSQLARYVMTVANSGNCYDLTLVDKITDQNGNTVSENDPVLHDQASLSGELWDAIHLGMREVVLNHKAFEEYNVSGGVAVSGKTGTAQEITTKPNHALFIGYAPSDAPTMSLACRIAYGYTSTNTAAMARDVIEYYFNQKDISELIPGHAIQVTTDNTRTD